MNSFSKCYLHSLKVPLQLCEFDDEFLCYAKGVQARRNTVSNSVAANIFIFELKRNLLEIFRFQHPNNQLSMPFTTES